MTVVSASTRLLGGEAGRASRTRRWITTGAVYAVVLVLCTLAAYWAMFSVFAAYDDEGFFDYSLKLFAGGHPLYTSVFSDYGPFYYEFFGALFKLFGRSVTTDAGRLIQLAVWIATSLGIGAACHRLSGRLSIGVASLVTAFALLNVLTNEPMHAEALIVLMLAAMVVLVAFALPAWPRPALCGIGALAGLLLVTKINIGGFAVISIGFAVVMARSARVRTGILEILAMIAFVLVGPALMVKNLNSGWARTFALLVALSAVSIVFVAEPAYAESRTDQESGGWPRWLVAGFAAAIAVVLAVIFALGTAPGDLINQTIVLPSHQSRFLIIPITLSNAAIWWALASAVVAWTLRRHWHEVGEPAITKPTLWMGVLRLVAGLAILLSLGGQFPFGFAPGAPFSLAMPLAWIAALPSRRDPPGSRYRLMRLLVPSLAVLQALVAYPVAGSQIGVGSVLFVTCGALCLGDAWADLVAWNAARPSGVPVVATWLAAAFAALAVGSTYLYVIQPLEANHNVYRAGVALHVKGATQLHVSAALAAEFDGVVSTVDGNCRTLISLPGLYSFNIMTGLDTPSPMTGAQPYWLSLSTARQRAAVAAAKASPGLCVVRNDALAANYGGAPPLSSPLVAYVEQNFKTIAQFGPYLVQVRR